MDVAAILELLKAAGRPEELEGMARFGIPAEMSFGVRMPELRRLARRFGTDPALAEALWASGYREARILASIVQDAASMPEALMESWLGDFDSWESTDQCVLNCFWKHPLAGKKALEWSLREPEFEKRAGFTLMAVLAVKDKKLANADFEPFLEAIVREAGDGRNYVRKSVNWALRQIGKRNMALNEMAVRVAEEIKAQGGRSASWIASDALRELRSEEVARRLEERRLKSPSRKSGCGISTPCRSFSLPGCRHTS